MRTVNVVGFGAVIVVGAAIGWVGTGESPTSSAAPVTAEADTNLAGSGSGAASNQWASTPIRERARKRSAAEDGGPDTGLPPPPPGVDVAAEATARAQGLNPQPSSTGPAGPDVAPATAVTTAAPPRPSSDRPAAPAGNGWRPGQDAGWGPPAGERAAGWGPSSR